MSETESRVLARVVFPSDSDSDALPLYVDGQDVPVAATGGVVPTGVPYDQSPDQVLGRRSYQLDKGQRASFATYFNAFPAGYWQRWSTLKTVKLQVATTGSGSVVVYRSSGRGVISRVTSARVEDSDSQVFELPLDSFGDGGWYWFDLSAGHEQFTLESAEWLAGDLRPDMPEPRTSTISLGITTFNRPAYCAALLGQLGAAEELVDLLDQVFVVDQGTQKVRDHESFDADTAQLGDRLRIIDQGNLGGSGGFSRGMLETVEAGRSSHVLLLDDDVVCEPEGIRRAATFSDYSRQPILVGGHMFSMYVRTNLHAFAEKVQLWRFRWMEASFTEMSHDLAASNLRSTPWMHRRANADYNGWWMCLIPVDVVREIGAALPFFIKWDDGEFGLRAKAAGYPTVSLPGAAVWHVPWTDKDDTVDWQTYYHARNRLIAALIHSPFERGGRTVLESLMISLKHVVSMQYSASALRRQAILDVLAGPERMHQQLPTSLRDVRAQRAQFEDAITGTSPDDFPPVRTEKPRKRDDEPARPPTQLGWVKAVTKSLGRQVFPVPKLAREFPEREVAAGEAGWWNLGRLNSAIVTSMDGKHISMYRRDRMLAMSQVREAVQAHEELTRQWPTLAKKYREAAAELTSPDAWHDTFERSVAASSPNPSPTGGEERR